MEALCISETLRVFDDCRMPDDGRMVLRLQDCIEEYFADEHSVDFYFAKLGITKRRLDRLTGIYLGKSVYEVLQDRIHAEVEKLLRHSTPTVKEISVLVGMTDPAYLTKCFKKRTGQSPTHWREGAFASPPWLPIGGGRGRAVI